MNQKPLIDIKLVQNSHQHSLSSTQLGRNTPKTTQSQSHRVIGGFNLMDENTLQMLRQSSQKNRMNQKKSQITSIQANNQVEMLPKMISQTPKIGSSSINNTNLNGKYIYSNVNFNNNNSNQTSEGLGGQKVSKYFQGKQSSQFNSSKQITKAKIQLNNYFDEDKQYNNDKLLGNFQIQKPKEERQPSSEKSWRQNYLRNLKDYQSVKIEKQQDSKYSQNFSNGQLEKDKNLIQMNSPSNSNNNNFNNFQKNEGTNSNSASNVLASFVTKVNRDDNILNNIPQISQIGKKSEYIQIKKNQSLQIQPSPSTSSILKPITPIQQIINFPQTTKNQRNRTGNKSNEESITKQDIENYNQAQTQLNIQQNSQQPQQQNNKIFHFPQHVKVNSFSINKTANQYPVSNGNGVDSNNNSQSIVNNNQNNNNNQINPNNNYQPLNNQITQSQQNNINQNINQNQNTNIINNNQNNQTLAQQQTNQNSNLNSQMENSQKNSQKNRPQTPKNMNNSNSNTTKQLQSSQKQFTYYMGSIEKAYKTPLGQDYFSQLAREHFLQTCQGILYSNLAKPADPKDLQYKKVQLKKRNPNLKKTIVFDLDETLIHCNENVGMPHDVKLQIKFPQGEIIEAGINVRPYAVDILRELSQEYEIVIFTASHQCYAKTVLDHLDPKGQYIHHRFFREHCIQTPQGVYIKDLRIFSDRNLEDLVLIDNAAYSFSFQVDNGIPILPFYHNKEDIELKHLHNYLKNIKNLKDVRELNRQTFKLQLFNDVDGPQKVYEKVFGRKN